LFHFDTCAVHTAHRIVSNAIGEKDLVGDCYAVQFVMSQPSVYSVLLRAWKAVIADELLVVPVPADWSPDPQHSEHLARIISHGLGRSVEHTRGKVSTDPCTLPTRAKGQFRFDDAKAKLMHFFQRRRP
jgi:hypothetical protein